MRSRVSAGRPYFSQLSANVSYNHDILSERIFGVGNRLHGAMQVGRFAKPEKRKKKTKFVPAS
jgi:hypothetical protein